MFLRQNKHVYAFLSLQLAIWMILNPFKSYYVTNSMDLNLNGFNIILLHLYKSIQNTIHFFKQFSTGLRTNSRGPRLSSGHLHLLEPRCHAGGLHLTKIPG